eukprot:Hpha_TRINITY_DN16308_c2_g1::TRINITY_DN16308_c2_g1_i1::g.58710::m.58710
MWDYCRWNWLVREGDTPAEARIRTLGFPLALFVMPFHVYFIVNTVLGTNQWVRVLGYATSALGIGQFLVGIVTNVVRPGYLMDGGMVCMTLGLLAVDLGLATLSTLFRAASLVVLMLDDALVFERDHMAPLLIGILIVYSIGLAVESVQRFGLYDLGYWGTAGVELSYCNCMSPPCESTPVDAFLNAAGFLILFLGDFYLTRGFAVGMRLQLRRVEACVDVTADLVQHLARYDVEAAKAALERKGEELPEGLEASFGILLENLRSYRDYLPETLMQQECQANTP